MLFLYQKKFHLIYCFKTQVQSERAHIHMAWHIGATLKTK